MPGVERLTIDRLPPVAERCLKLRVKDEYRLQARRGRRHPDLLRAGSRRKPEALAENQRDPVRLVGADGK